MNDTKMIKCENIHKSYGTLEVLRGVSLEVSQGEVVSVVGPSGAGKTAAADHGDTLADGQRTAGDRRCGCLVDGG